MIVALDYDDTITADIAAFAEVVEVFKRRGHRVIICTARHGIGGWRDKVVQVGILWEVPVYFTGGQPKRKYLNDRGIIVDVWVDDMPWMI